MSYLKADWNVAARAIAEALTAAQESALKQTEELFPVGSLVLVDGAHNRAFTMRVTRHGSHWSDPTTVYGENVKTGKPRRFYAGVDRVLRVDSPPTKGKR